MRRLAKAYGKPHIGVMTKPEPQPAEKAKQSTDEAKKNPPREIGGPKGPEPTRHGDWEFNGRCTDF